MIHQDVVSVVEFIGGSAAGGRKEPPFNPLDFFSDLLLLIIVLAICGLVCSRLFFHCSPCADLLELQQSAGLFRWAY